MQDIIGKYGLLAWDYGRILAVIKWGVGVNWLTEKEAIDIAKPFIDELINSYDSWEDYAAHYSLGRCFYAISNAYDYEDYLNVVMETMKKYDIEVSDDEKDKVFTCHNLKFPAKHQGGNRILKYEDAVYNPSKDANTWIIAIKASQNYDILTPSECEIFSKFLEKSKKIPSVAIYKFDMYLNEERKHLSKSIFPLMKNNPSEKEIRKIKRTYSNFYRKAIEHSEEANACIEKVKVKNDEYYEFYIQYALYAFNYKDLKKMQALATKIDDKCEFGDGYFIHCLYNTELAKKCVAKRQYDYAVIYAETALDNYKKAVSLPNHDILSNEAMKIYEQFLNELIDSYSN